MSRDHHTLHLTHRRYSIIQSMGAQLPHDSTVDIDVDSADLVEAWAELFSRMPNDIYAAAKEAFKKAGI